MGFPLMVPTYRRHKQGVMKFVGALVRAGAVHWGSEPQAVPGGSLDFLLNQCLSMNAVVGFWSVPIG